VRGAMGKGKSVADVGVCSQPDKGRDAGLSDLLRPDKQWADSAPRARHLG